MRNPGRRPSILGAPEGRVPRIGDGFGASLAPGRDPELAKPPPNRNVLKRPERPLSDISKQDLPAALGRVAARLAADPDARLVLRALASILQEAADAHGPGVGVTPSPTRSSAYATPSAYGPSVETPPAREAGRISPLGRLRATLQAASASAPPTTPEPPSHDLDAGAFEVLHEDDDEGLEMPLKAENRGKIKGIVHDTSSTGQTLFVEPEDVLQLGNALRELEAEERAEEVRILGLFSKSVGRIAPETTGGVEAASGLDLAFAKARLAFDMKGCLPRPEPGSAFVAIQGGKHPLLDPDMAVPLDIEVGRGASVLITGPNTGGKTVAIKAVGLTVLMAQSGLFPPALDVRLAPFTSVWADIGDEQSLEQSLSTFSGHIKNIAEALRKLEDGALVLLDEIGAGTDPAEGAALAKAILAQMADQGATILASTHYGELKAFAYNVPGFTNAAMEFDPRTLQPTYRLLMGTPGASQALRIAERYGIPTPVVETARASLGSEAQDLALMLERLEAAQRQARLAQSEADRRANQLKKDEATAKRKLAEADEIRRTANEKAQAVIEAALREIRLEAARLFDEIKGAGKATDAARQGLKDLDAAGTELARSFTPKARRPKDAPPIRKGAVVRLAGHSQVGHVLDDPKDGKAPVQLGSLKMTVPVASLEPVDKAPKEIVRARPNIQLAKALTVSPEVDLRHLRAEEAVRELERFLDDASLGGLESVRIVHGKGEGVLRVAVQAALKGNRGIAGYRDGDATEGGAGVTVATLA